ncbi:MAG: glycosyltransferase, partial [Armatimonadota bacterium]
MLCQEGISCEVQHPRRIALRKLKEYDLVLLQKKLMPAYWIIAASRACRRLVFDFDDAVWTSPHGNWSILSKAKARTRLGAVLSCASCVIAGNEYLARYAHRYNPKVKVIPTCIDTDYYRPVEHSSKTLSIGWIGSSPNLPYLAALEPVFARLSSEKVKLMVVCDKEYRSSLTTEFIPWDLKAELASIQSMDIGIMPLPDDEWTRGKCGFKSIQYMSCGIPSVSSPVGFNNELIDDGANGFL